MGEDTPSNLEVVPALNHTIVWCTNKQRGAAHVVEVLGIEAPREFAGQFLVVEMGNGVSLDYADWPGDEITPQHLAFLVSEDEFDAIYGRIKAKAIDHWADPSKHTRSEINHHDGGRGVYWNDPDGHLLEIITRPYGAETEGSGG